MEKQTSLQEIETEAAGLAEEAKARATALLKEAREEAKRLEAQPVEAGEAGAACAEILERAAAEAREAVARAEEEAAALRERSAAVAEECLHLITQTVRGGGS